MLWRPLLFSLGPSARGKIVAVSRAPRGNSFNHLPHEQSIFVYYKTSDWKSSYKTSDWKSIWKLFHPFVRKISYSYSKYTSGVARAFPDGRVAHPEGQNEDENKYSLRKNKKKLSKFEEKNEEIGTLAHHGL